jgi:acetaldehyde dehydrogenase/alcohol dehydrogenase
LVADALVRDKLIAALEREAAAVLDVEEAGRFLALAVIPDGSRFDSRMIGQSAQLIAGQVVIARYHPIRLIVVPAGLEAIERGSPLAGEKLMPLLSLFIVDGDEQAFAVCRRILSREGAGHTAAIHTRTPERAERFGMLMPASRILVNRAHSLLHSGLWHVRPQFDHGQCFLS